METLEPIVLYGHKGSMYNAFQMFHVSLADPTMVFEQHLIRSRYRLCSRSSDCRMSVNR